MQPADDPHNLVLTHLMGLWADRADQIYEQRKATTAFRRALRAAVDEDNVPIAQVAAALGISRKAVRRHRDAARALVDTS